MEATTQTIHVTSDHHAVVTDSEGHGQWRRHGVRCMALLTGRHSVSFALCGALLLAAVAAFAEPTPSTNNDGEPRLVIKAEVGRAREQALGIRRLTGYPADAGRCGNELLGPLPEAEYTGEEAWLTLIAPVCSVVRREDPQTGRVRAFADMSRCKCSFGLARLKPLDEAHVLVVGSSLPELGERVPSSTSVLGRKEIEASGAVNVPDLLRYLSQTSFHRGVGYRPTNAQYAELRGLGAAYTLVLINGRRAFGTAADLASSAFDLSAIPISAVERIEISLDANSLIHGMDAIGGIINIVLSERVEPAYALRYGELPGGASLGQASMSGGVDGDRGRFAVFFDADTREELLGRERDRWNNQDYRRFGGQDYRSSFASPFNISSLDGTALPGLASPSAVGDYNPHTRTLEFRAGEASLASLRSYQSIVPSSLRKTLSANGTTTLGPIVASAEALLVQRETDFQTLPPIVAGYTWGANHPENPFHVPVRVNALLAALPPQRLHAQTQSHRVVLAAEGQAWGWDLSSFAVLAGESSDVASRNATDPTAIAKALLAEPREEDEESGAEPIAPLSLYRVEVPGEVPPGIVLPRSIERYSDRTSQLQMAAQGALVSVPAGAVMLNAGVEYRQERMAFNPHAPSASRDIDSVFTQARIPLVNAAMQLPGVQDFKLILGARRDHYSDIGEVTKSQIGLTWRLSESLSAHASASESYRPPSLVELYMPRVMVPTLIFDPAVGQLISIDLITGGNRMLRPTSGHSESVGVAFRPSEQWRISADYWRVKAKGHVSLFAPMSLLAHEQMALPGRVLRDESTGRLLQLDISRANVGGATTEGVDLAMDGELDTPMGRLSAGLSMTYTEKFLYSELPITQARMEDRAGIASEFGSIPKLRSVVSLAYQRGGWQATLHGRIISAYRDRDPRTGAPMQRRISGGPLWDLNLSKEVGGNVRVMVGAFNVMNQEPPFARAGGSLGFDNSQADLEGRELYIRLTGGF